ncbi:MAG TPA: protein phosphatase 2C domain-containing protein [Gammaproteobacteria bacterium]|nr:protein phosphatase 2C domain-containing protein [Gammaproteobacteria bacterium]
MNHDPVRWTSHAVSHVGTVRKINEDACLDLPAAGLWAVADGMGGHSSGDVASRSIVTALQALPATDSLAMLADHVEDALERVNTELRELAESASRHTIGSTVVVLAIRRRHALIAWAGDSRVYRLREGRLEQLTQDHAIVEDMVEIGLISREEALAHPQANRITRAVGAMEALYLDMDIHEIAPGDRFLLCSDGLYKELGDNDIARVLGGRGNTAKAAVDLAVERGARDNVTAVTIAVEKA